MNSLPLHDAQIILMCFNPVLSEVDILLHRCNSNEQYFVVKIRIRGVKSIETIDGKDINDMFVDGGGVYTASIDTFSDFELFDLSGPDYWRLKIKADKIDYEELEVTEKEIDKLLDQSFGTNLFQSICLNREK